MNTYKYLHYYLEAVYVSLYHPLVFAKIKSRKVPLVMDIWP